MAKETLLDMVQQILSDADSDEVNSITDTVESDQCARVIRDVFNELVDHYDWDHNKTLVQLTATTATTPNVMDRPEGFWNIEFLKYDKRNTAGGDADYTEVFFMEPLQFVQMTASRADSDTTIDEVTLDSGFVLLVRNDIQPTYYTIMEGYDQFIFDAYDSTLETNLQASKSLAYGIQKPSLVLADATTPDLPNHMYTLLKRQARAVYFDLYKDGMTAEIDRSRRHAEVRAQRQRRLVKNQDNQTGPDYGRKGRGR